MLSAELRPQGSIHGVGDKNSPIHSRLLTESLKPVHCLRIVWSTSSSREFLEMASRQMRSAFTHLPAMGARLGHERAMCNCEQSLEAQSVHTNEPDWWPMDLPSHGRSKSETFLLHRCRDFG